MSDTSRIAHFSPDRVYRYWLEIRWAAGRAINFLMLNPSTADEQKNDPTVERCERRARMWDYPAVIITNLFAVRATDPKDMLAHQNPTGRENDKWIVQAYAESTMTIAAWGAHGKHLQRSRRVRQDVLGGMPLKCLKYTGGEPWHPLYLPYSLEPIDLPEWSHRKKHIPIAVRREIEGRPCANCGKTYDIQVDHIVPVSKGGTDDPSNLQPLCKFCNVVKGNRATSNEELKQYIEGLRRQRSWIG